MSTENPKTELLGILKGLRDYIANEYSLNVEPRSYKGENANDSTLPADWQKKLEPISGGPGGERQGDHGAESKATAAGSQSKDAYLHKELDANGEVVSKGVEAETYEESGKSPMASPPQAASGLDTNANAEVQKGAYMADNGEEVVGENNNEEMDNGEVVADEVIDEDNLDYEDKMGDNHDDVVSLLREIKNVLEQTNMQKQALGEIQNLKDEVGGLTKSLPEMIDSQINSGIKAGLKQFGWNAGSGDVPRRVANKNTSQVAKAKAVPMIQAPQPVVAPEMDPASRIGVEGESLMKAAGPVNDHNAFVDGVDQLAGMTEVDDLRGAFRLINQMREDSGDSLSRNLFYYK